MVSTAKIILVLLIIVLIDRAQARLSEVPRKYTDWCGSSEEGACCFLAPPQRPERFHSREELKRYLQKVCSFARSNCISNVSVFRRFMSIMLSSVDGACDVSIRNNRLFLWPRMIKQSLVRNISETVSPPYITSDTMTTIIDLLLVQPRTLISFQSFVNALISYEVQ
jgi:hypothetical protein